MNAATLLIFGAFFFVLAYRFYGRYLSRKFGIDPTRPTPAQTMTDGIDYVPTRPVTLMGHHFASISGAGPIVGPILGATFGWAPVLAWILLGSVFIGAFHDFAALFISVRHDGRSIGSVIEHHLGFVGRQLFLLFCWTTLVLVLAVFTLLVAHTFTAEPAAATASILFVALAPIFGWLVYRRKMPLTPASLIFVPLMMVLVIAGLQWPVNPAELFGWSPGQTINAWIAVLIVYVSVASILPVWLLLQPRDYLNAFLLYALLVLGAAAVMVARPEIKLTAFSGFYAVNPEQPDHVWSMFPILFVVVACGAISGFHALVASGTSAKQIASERHIVPVGYGSMLIEGFLAIIALISVAVLSTDGYRQAVAGHGAVAALSGGLAEMSGALHLPYAGVRTFISLVVSAFMLTTLDTATRLARLIWQELVQGMRPAMPCMGYAALSNRYGATLISLAATLYLVISGQGMRLWPVFGASNQLLAGLTLLTVSVWMLRRGKSCWIAALPAFFMLAICMTALANQFGQNLASGNSVLSVTIALIIVPAIVLLVKTASFLKARNHVAF